MRRLRAHFAGARFALAASGWAALASTTLPAASPVRIVLPVAFLIICPGAAAVRLARPVLERHGHALDALEAACLTVALSVSAATLVAEAFFISRTFTTARALGVLALLTSLLALLPWHDEPQGGDRDGP